MRRHPLRKVELNYETRLVGAGWVLSLRFGHIESDTANTEGIVNVN